MGSAKRKKQAFLEEHPQCCFCGGRASATTIDHVPLRAAFKDRIGPDGFEFPACGTCNVASSTSEQVFALCVRLFDRDDRNTDSDQLWRLIQGVRNNAPEAVPTTRMSANEKRRVLRHWGFDRGDAFLNSVGLASIPKAVEPHLKTSIWKLLAALRYKHLGSFLAGEYAITTRWSQLGLPGSLEAVDGMLGVMPNLVLGKRVNTSIGNQFAYRWGYAPQEDLFGILAAFGEGLLVLAGSVPLTAVTIDGDWQPYSPTSELINGFSEVAE